MAAVPSGVRNFHIFYYLMAGASPEERHHLHLADKTQYHYLGQRAGTSAPPIMVFRMTTPLTSNSSSWHSNPSGFLSNMLPKHASSSRLSSTWVTSSSPSTAVDAAVVRNIDVLSAEFLGVQPSTLESMLSYKPKLIKKELCTAFPDPDGASDHVMTFLRHSTLRSPPGSTNTSTNASTTMTSTLSSDFYLPSPQNMASCPNSLDQFFVNFANERLQGFIQKRIFESHIDKYKTEGISRFVPLVPYFDNAECVCLLQNRPGGLIYIMDVTRLANHTRRQTIRWWKHSPNVGATIHPPRLGRLITRDTQLSQSTTSTGPLPLPPRVSSIATLTPLNN